VKLLVFQLFHFAEKMARLFIAFLAIGGKKEIFSLMPQDNALPPGSLPPIFLIGPRCCGKSTVGRLLAGRTGFVLRDTDVLIGEHSGLSVEEIVLREGWKGFRARESEVLAFAAKPNSVVSTGGGMVLDARNRLLMRDAGPVFYLAAPLQCLYSRLVRNGNPGQRPSLTGAAPLEEMALVLEQREKLYRECAHYCVDASVPAAKVARAIFHILKWHFGTEYKGRPCMGIPLGGSSA
jgi:shikimate kinase